MSVTAIGIDLGTTNSCVAVFRNGAVEIIRNEYDSYTVPSWVCFSENGVLIGQDALNESHIHIQRSIYEVKRVIGEKFNNPKIQEDLARLTYTIFQDADGVLKIKVPHEDGEKTFRPEEISAYVLQKLKQLAEERLDQTVDRVVVTVPAYFNDQQRQATKDAAQIAGFKAINIVNEPTAAALAFNFQNPKPYQRNVLVYDFGGGTFDVSIVAVGRGKCRVRATSGDSHLGGADVDNALMDFVRADFRDKYGTEPEKSEQIMKRLKSYCEKLKKTLSGGTTTVNVELINFSGQDYFGKITRESFEAMNAPLFARTMDIVKQCLEACKMTKEDMDEVVLVGGSSRIPKVQQLLRECFGADKISKGVNPDEAVAYGAAIHAHNLAGDKSEIVDVVSLSLGIEVFGGFFSIIAPCNSSVPLEKTEAYYTVFDGQEAATIAVYQGEERLAKNNFPLGSFVLKGLRKAPAGQVKVDVLFDIDAEGILHVTALEAGANNEKSIDIDVKKTGLSQENIAERMAELELSAKNEIKRKEFLNAKYELESLCERMMVDFGDFEAADDPVIRRCEEVVARLKECSVKNYEEVKQTQKEMDAFYRELSEKK